MSELYSFLSTRTSRGVPSKATIARNWLRVPRGEPKFLRTKAGYFSTLLSNLRNKISSEKPKYDLKPSSNAYNTMRRHVSLNNHLIFFFC